MNFWLHRIRNISTLGVRCCASGIPFDVDLDPASRFIHTDPGSSSNLEKRKNIRYFNYNLFRVCMSLP
jgi:hypothetical protein